MTQPKCTFAVDVGSQIKEAKSFIEASKNIGRELAKNKEKLARDALENGVCPVCGEPVKSGMWLVKISKPLEEELVLTCPRGHEWSHGVASVILR